MLLSKIMKSAIIAVSLAATILPATAYSKANFVIWPIYPVIESDEKAVAVWLENTGDTPAIVQVRTFKWTQQNFKEQYQMQNEVIASPPVVRINAGQKQMIRLTKSFQPIAATEQAYRLLIDELPVDPDQKNTGPQVSFQMRYSIPLFVYGTGIGSGLTEASKKQNDKNPLAKPILSWQITHSGMEEVLEIKNSGLKHTRISEVKVGDYAAQLQAKNNGLGYLLANSSMQFGLSAELKKALHNNPILYSVNNKNQMLEIKKQP